MKAVLFDLDGTLLPMDQEEFIGAYFTELAKVVCDEKIEPQEPSRGGHLSCDRYVRQR